MMSRNWVKDHEEELKAFGLRNLVATVSHPFEYAKLLMQLGYEPFPPVESRTIFLRAKYLALPNVLSYLRYIKSVDGFFGCYRGLLPKLCESNIYYFSYNKCSQYCPIDRSKDGRYSKNEIRPRPSYVTDFIPSDIRQFIKTLSWDCVSVTVGTTVSFPFHVIAVRSMAQFVGRECKYDSLINSICEIYNTDGLLGFFKGLVPRLISDWLNVIITGTCIFVITKYFTKENQQLTAFGSGFVASTFSYQFHLVSNNMAANNSALLIGSPPHAYKHYTSWYDCWATLRCHGQLSRGSAMIGRHYTGPIIRGSGGIMPVGFVFGPLHPAGLGKTCLKHSEVYSSKLSQH